MAEHDQFIFFLHIYMHFVSPPGSYTAQTLHSLFDWSFTITPSIYGFHGHASESIQIYICITVFVSNHILFSTKYWHDLHRAM